MRFHDLEGVLMSDFVQGVQPSVQPSVQGKCRAVIGLCKVCKAFACAHTRENKIILGSIYNTSRAYVNAKNPAHLAHALSGAGFALHTPLHTPLHTLHKL